MQIEIIAQGFTLSEALREHIERRLDFAIGRFDDRIERVIVRLEDVDGARGGADTECRMQVKLHGLPSVNISQSADDIYAAVDQAADRTGHTVARKVEKATEPGRKDSYLK